MVMYYTQYLNGNPIVFTTEGSGLALYSSDFSVVDPDNVRPCPRCAGVPTPEGYDHCLGFLEGVEYACCGHGNYNQAYVMLSADRSVLRGEEALEFFEGRRKP